MNLQSMDDEIENTLALWFGGWLFEFKVKYGNKHSTFPVFVPLHDLESRCKVRNRAHKSQSWKNERRCCPFAHLPVPCSGSNNSSRVSWSSSQAGYISHWINWRRNPCIQWISSRGWNDVSRFASRRLFLFLLDEHVHGQLIPQLIPQSFPVLHVIPHLHHWILIRSAYLAYSILSKVAWPNQTHTILSFYSSIVIVVPRI